MKKDLTARRTNFSTNMHWKTVGLIILSIRFVQGWIFWAGGSRRFIYAPEKLDPHSANWLANKLQSAMPGALLGTESVIGYLLDHFYILYLALVIFSLAELISGLALLAGFFTRLAAFTTALISIALMLVFGWEGSTCLDEWTMAVANLSMALTLMLSGASIYSIDSWLMHRNPALQKKHWFISLASGPLSLSKLKLTTCLSLFFTIVFTTGTYDYYRGAIFSRYHTGPVSASVLHITLSKGWAAANGDVTFTLDVNAGDTAVPSHIIRIELLNLAGTILETWDGNDLHALPGNNIINTYPYNRITTGPYGLVAPVSAVAKIKLNPVHNKLQLSAGNYRLQLYTINGRRWDLSLEEK
jgi:uncharacterized membrane protein YphA (DoxX/SURF4 family)